MERLADTVARLEADLQFRCHRYFIESGIRKYQFAKLAGVSDTLLKGIEDRSFTASIKTLCRLDAVIPAEWQPSEPRLPQLAADRIDRAAEVMAAFILARQVWRNDRGECLKYDLDPRATAQIEPGQLSRVLQHADSLRHRESQAPDTGDILFRVVAGLAPQCLVAQLDAGAADPHGYRLDHVSGPDVAGVVLPAVGGTLGEIADPLTRACLEQDVLVARETGWASCAAVERSGEVGRHAYLRLIIPVPDAGRHSRLLFVARSWHPLPPKLAREAPATALSGASQTGASEGLAVDGLGMPMTWKPESTDTISPVTPRDRSLRR
jgi:hypothetical protein